MHIAPAHKAFDAYEAALADFRERHVAHEGAVRIAFHTLLDALAPPRWKVIGEQTMGHIRLA
jgi:NADPH-dependent 7-cyano-7-deazaguanine reductase QueF